jgi:hypothetical protein
VELSKHLVGNTFEQRDFKTMFWEGIVRYQELAGIEKLLK